MIVLIACISIWNIIYINELYSEKEVHLGWGRDKENDDGEQVSDEWAIPKYQFVLFNFCNGIMWATFFFYFYYVANLYSKGKKKEKKKK